MPKKKKAQIKEASLGSAASKKKTSLIKAKALESPIEVKKRQPKAKSAVKPIKAAKKRAIIKKVRQPVVNNHSVEEIIEASKYYARPVIQKFAEKRPFELPAGYGDNRIVLLVRDPHWLYAYWEINHARRQEIINEIGEDELSRSQLVLRVNDTNSWESFDIDVNFGANNWYVHVPAAGRTYCVEIGYRTTKGEFIAAARSNWVTTPLDRMSDIIDEEWLMPDWGLLYSLSGGLNRGQSSWVTSIRPLRKK